MTLARAVTVTATCPLLLQLALSSIRASLWLSSLIPLSLILPIPSLATMAAAVATTAVAATATHPLLLQLVLLRTPTTLSITPTTATATVTIPAPVPTLATMAAAAATYPLLLQLGPSPFHAETIPKAIPRAAAAKTPIQAMATLGRAARRVATATRPLLL